jgi:hypothetical protein
MTAVTVGNRDRRETTFQELLVSNVIEQEALINLLERKGIITNRELTEEIQRLRKEKQ